MIDANELVQKVRQWGYDRNLCTLECIESQMLKQVSEHAEIHAAIYSQDKNGVMDGFGDCLVVATLTAERLGFNLDPNLIACVIEGNPVNSMGFGSIISLGLLCDLVGKKQYQGAKLELQNYVINLCDEARQIGLDPLECLAASYEEIKDRKGVMYNGMFIKESDPEYNRAYMAIQAARLQKDFDSQV